VSRGSPPLPLARGLQACAPPALLLPCACTPACSHSRPAARALSLEGGGTQAKEVAVTVAKDPEGAHKLEQPKGVVAKMARALTYGTSVDIHEVSAGQLPALPPAPEQALPAVRSCPLRRATAARLSHQRSPASQLNKLPRPLAPRVTQSVPPACTSQVVEEDELVAAIHENAEQHDPKAEAAFAYLQVRPAAAAASAWAGRALGAWCLSQAANHCSDLILRLARCKMPSAIRRPAAPRCSPPSVSSLRTAPARSAT
jgi:hypothetical protein